MEYLIVSATSLEIEPLLIYFEVQDIPAGKIIKASSGNLNVCFLVTGVGMMQAAYHLRTALDTGRFGHVIQAGIAGAFERRIQIGEVVAVHSQQYGDLGAWDAGKYLDVYDLELMDPDAHPFHSGKLVNHSAGSTMHTKLEAVRSLSVNQITSTKERMDELVHKYNPQIESMEGIAFHYACLHAGVSYAEIRGISNHVEPRNKDNWDIQGAIEQLNNYLLLWLNDKSA